MTVVTPAKPTPAAWVLTQLRQLRELVRAVMHGDDKRNQAQRNAMLAFSVRVASAGLLYLSQIVLARWMGDFEYGIYVLVWTWVLVLGGLAHLGLGLVMIRLLPEYRETGQWALARGLLRGGRLLALAFSTTTALAGFAGLWWLGESISSHYVLPAFLALVCLPMFTLSEVQDGIGRANGWIAAALAPQYVMRPLLLLVGMIAAYSLGMAMVATTAAAIAIAATWLATITQTFLLHARLPAEARSGERQYTLRSWLLTALPLLAMSAAELAMQNADVLVLSRYLSPADVGVYFAAAKTMALVLFVHYAVGSAVAHGLSGLKARGDADALAAHVRDAVNWTFWPSAAGTIVILLLGPFLLSLFGPRFADGYVIMLILAVGFLGRAAVGPGEFILNMLGEQVRCAAVLLAAAALNIALQMLLVPQMGAKGAAIATSIALLASATAQAIVARRRLGLSLAIWRNLSRH